MKVVALFLALVLAVSSLTEDEYRSSFDSFKLKYQKNYLPSEEQHRYEVYKNNLDFVNNWDASNGFSVKMNSYGDLSSEEFGSLFNGVRVSRDYESVPYTPLSNPEVQGDIVDWRTKGAVTGIKNQGQCGSCWSFSATGSMEGAHFLKTGSLVSLSEQNLVDCSTSEGNDGCNGGLMDQAFEYVIKNHGIDTEASYRYTATGPNQCRFSAANVGATISSYHDIPSGDENALQTAVDQQPVSVAIDASHSSFQFYSSGVYYEPQCSSTQLDHGVLAVGYGTDGDKNYWIVKNSWGTDWGMSGYINMSKNRNNNCGIATAASYPIV